MAAQAPAQLTHCTTPSANGALLSYYATGQGYGLIALHDSDSYALTQSELVVLLSASNTVYLPSSRGYGLSGPFPESVTSISAVLPSKPLFLNDPSTPNPQIKFTGTSIATTYDPLLEMLLSGPNSLTSISLLKSQEQSICSLRAPEPSQLYKLVYLRLPHWLFRVLKKSSFSIRHFCS
jgi:hypothetical protein